MSVIKIRVDDQQLAITNMPVIASGGIEENQIEFDFSSDWDGFACVACFYRDNKAYSSFVSATGVANVPHEVTATDGKMWLGVMGVHDGVTKTSELVFYKILQGAITEDFDPGEPTPDIYNQILDYVSGVVDLEQRLVVVESESSTNTENIITQTGRIDNMINSQQNESVTTLWTGTLDTKNQSVTLSENINNFDFIDVYVDTSQTQFIRKPVSNTILYEIQTQNMSDDASVQFLRWWETRLTITGTTATINKCIKCYWDDFSSVPVVSQATDGATVVRINGIKIGHVEDDEIVDARVGEDGVTYPNLGDAIRTQFTNMKHNINDVATRVIGKNLIDNDHLEDGMIQTDGTIRNDGAYANYGTTGFIELEANKDYSLTGYLRSTLEPRQYNRFAYMLYDSTRTMIPNSYVNTTSTPLTFNSGNAKYIRLSFDVRSEVPLYAQLELGVMSAYEPYKEVYASSGYMLVDNELVFIPDEFEKKVSILKNHGKNLIDPAKIAYGTFINSAGGLGNNENYDTCDYIPIRAGQSITFSPRIRGGLLFNTKKIAIESSYVNTYQSTPYTFTATEDGYARASFFVTQEGQFQAEYGDHATGYLPYDDNDYFQNNIKLSESMKAEIDSLITVNGSSITVGVSGSTIVATSEINGHSLSRTYYKQLSTANKLFNFNQAKLDGVVIKESSDDITPQRLSVNGISAWTVGANHGWASLQVNVGSLTVADVGSVWTDGTTEFTLALVDESHAAFIYPCTKNGSSFYFDQVAPTSDLIHVSGATHTSSIPISSYSLTQVFPGVNHHTVKIVIGDEEITENGTYTCNEFDVIEHYEIMDYAVMNTYLKNHIGVNLWDVRDEIDSVLAVDIVYHITPQDELVYTCVTAIESIKLANCGFMQAYVLSANNYDVYRYVNGVKSGAFFDSSHLVPMNNYGTNHWIYKTDLIDVEKPSNRCVDVAKDSNGVIQYGFAIGFIPDIGYGSDAKRAEMDMAYVWDMRSTKKIYPSCIANKTLNVGESANVAGYRHYIVPDQDITNKSVVPVGDKKYVFLDAHEIISTSVELDKYGNDVIVLDSDSANVSDFVGAKGITFETTNDYGFAVLKIK